MAMRFLRNRLMQLVIDGFVVALAFAAAYAVRFEGLPPRTYIKQFLLVLPYLILLRVGIFAALGVYRLVWRYISLRDLPRILTAVGSGTALAISARFGAAPFFAALGFEINPVFATVPYGVIAIELILTTAGLISVRSIWRLANERPTRPARRPRSMERQRKALLIGAGSGGVAVAREIKSSPDLSFEIAGFLDDDARKVGTIIHGYRVHGATDDLARFAHDLEADLVVITIASASPKTIRRIVDLAENAGLKVQIIPRLSEILSGQFSLSRLRDVAIEDLLSRPTVELDEFPIQSFLKGKVVLVTGAGGSIGSEICRQVGRYQPKELLLLDQAENPLFRLERELNQAAEAPCILPLLGSVVDRGRMAQIISRHKPDVIFHAAAHKHVPLMEANPSQAIINNVVGSRRLAELADELGVEVFVMISTDKAVNPSSVMGASKRLAEMYIQALSRRSRTRFLTVRFGNVLGSEGSVVQIFKEQIAAGGPLTVTHPEMKRYFMTIPEASQLVLQAGTMGKGGEIFILEMGEPIPIVNLARDLIRLSGYRPGEEIPIQFSGIRPGEKLYEEINLSEENATKTKHPRIWIGNSTHTPFEELAQGIDGLQTLAETAAPEEIRSALAQWVPEYRSEESPRKVLSGVAPTEKESLGNSYRTTGVEPLTVVP